MDFRPNCGTMLTSAGKRERRKVVLPLLCLRCGYKKRLTRSIPTITKIIEHFPQERIAVIGKEEQRLRTLPTVRIECPKCGKNLAYAWMVQMGSLEEHSTLFFRCTKCNYTFRDNR